MTGYFNGVVVRDAGATPAVAELRLPEIGPGQVRVRIRAAGVCHSDLSMVNGTLRPPYPLVLGHEAAGEVVEVGEHVTRAAVGDHVVLNWQPACRECWFCLHGEPWLCATSSGVAALENGVTLDGAPVHVSLGLGAFADQVVAPENAVIAVPSDLDFDLAALIGCGVLTGTGAVRNTARVAAGESVVVIGLGAVGLSVVAAARSAGAVSVIAVFECVGRAATIRAAWRATRRGGQVTVVGMGRKDDLVELSALDIFSSARTLRASVYGGGDPDVEVPALARDVLSGALSLDHLITDRIGLADIPAAFDRMSRGEGARSVVML
jgi:S-(hydroxymethyl)glutathione dehydrogenase/alcohol dehydrogenase